MNAVVMAHLKKGSCISVGQMCAVGQKKCVGKLIEDKKSKGLINNQPLCTLHLVVQFILFLRRWDDLYLLHSVAFDLQRFQREGANLHLFTRFWYALQMFH